MNGFVIKYNDIYNLLWEYKSKLENLMERIDVCQESINRFIGDSGFQGKAATAIKSYMNDVHLTMLSSFRVTIQSLLDNIVLYKAGYYGIDDSTNFVIPEETIKEFRTKLNTNYMEMQEQEDGVYRAVSGISDISSVGQPDTNQVPKIHQQLDQELLNLITDIETQESSTVTALEQSTELLITSLNNCIGKIGTNWTDINSYEGNSFYTDVDAYVLANLSQMFYQQHEANQEVYDEIWEVEQSLKDAAEERETMGIWKTIGGAALVITGVFCIAASGGAATPVVVAGWTSGGVTVAFGVCDSIEGAQDIYYGSMGDIDSTAFNCLKDVVFQGNEDAYYMVESIFACSASACIPISRASQVGQMTFRSGSVIAAKEVMSTVIGNKASELTMDFTGNRTLSMLAGMVSSNASAHGLNGLDARFKISGSGSTSKIGYEYLDDQLGSLKDKVKINQYQSAESVNDWWKARGYKSPYKEKTVVQNITLTEDTKFVRVYDGVNSNLEGGWVMRAEDIKGLTPKEIQVKFALEYEPIFIGEVELKAGDTIRLGEVGPNFGFDGGGIQIDLQQQWIGDFSELGKIEDWR